MPLFHLAISVTNLDESRAFYGGLLGCVEGRSTDSWVDYNFFGHQLTLHLGTPFKAEKTGLVDGVKVPIPHFGAILDMPVWRKLADHLTKVGVDFVLPPCNRFEGKPGEQCTMFFHDPSGNPIEIKGVTAMNEVFET